MKKDLLAVAMALIVISVVGLGCSAFGDEAILEVRYGVGTQALVYGLRYTFVGITGRMALASTGPAAALFELGLAHEPGADDFVLQLDASAVAYFKSGNDRGFLGLGIGFARWEDKMGWDRGIWYQNYRKFIAGWESSFDNLPVFWQTNFTLGAWFNPIVSAGVWF